MLVLILLYVHGRKEWKEGMFNDTPARKTDRLLGVRKRLYVHVLVFSWFVVVDVVVLWSFVVFYYVLFYYYYYFIGFVLLLMNFYVAVLGLRMGRWILLLLLLLLCCCWLWYVLSCLRDGAYKITLAAI